MGIIHNPAQIFPMWGGQLMAYAKVAFLSHKLLLNSVFQILLLNSQIVLSLSDPALVLMPPYNNLYADFTLKSP